jgi:GAF domain-containing protein
MVTMDALPTGQPGEYERVGIERVDRLAPGVGERADRFLAEAHEGHLRAITDHRRAADDLVRIEAEHEQATIDAEMRATRRRALQLLRLRSRTDPAAIAGADFLAVADEAGVLEGVPASAIIGAQADACDLQLYHPRTRTLHLVAQRGFTAEFVARFASVDPSTPTACAAALATREPVVVEDVTTSPIFMGRPTLDVMLAAGSRAVQSYPLLSTGGDVLGMLSFHYRRPRPEVTRQGVIASAVATALVDAGVAGVRTP